MDSGNAPGRGPVGKVLPTRTPISGSVYAAFEEYNRRICQHKYMIAEYEDTLENLQKDLKEGIDKNKVLEIECEKLQATAEAAEANYNKKTKEKVLMENDYRALSKEMDEVMTKLTKKRNDLKRVKLLHREKIEQINTMEEKYMAEYIRDPKIARRVAIAHKLTDLEDALKEIKKVLKGRQVGFKKLDKRKKEELEIFKKKCIKIAEMYCERQQKLSELNKLRSKYEGTLKASQVGVSNCRVPLSQPLPSNPLQPSGTSQPSDKATIGTERSNSQIKFNAPSQRRSSTFQQLDRLFYNTNSIGGSFTTPRTFEGVSAESSSSLNYFRSPLKTGLSLVSDIKSKLKGTVAVRPMPRHYGQKMEKVSKQDTSANAVTKYLTQTPKPETNIDNKDILLQPTDEELSLSIEEQSILIINTSAITKSDSFLLPPPPPVKKSVEKMEYNQSVCDVATPTTSSASIKSNVDVEMTSCSVKLSPGTPSCQLSMDDSVQNANMSQDALSPGGDDSTFFPGFASTPIAATPSSGRNWNFGLFGEDVERDDKTPDFNFMFT